MHRITCSCTCTWTRVSITLCPACKSKHKQEQQPGSMRRYEKGEGQNYPTYTAAEEDDTDAFRAPSFAVLAAIISFNSKTPTSSLRNRWNRTSSCVTTLSSRSTTRKLGATVSSHFGNSRWAPTRASSAFLRYSSSTEEFKQFSQRMHSQHEKREDTNFSGVLTTTTTTPTTTTKQEIKENKDYILATHSLAPSPRIGRTRSMQCTLCCRSTRSL